MKRDVITSGATAKNIAASIGRIASNRKSLSASNSAAAAHVPTHAFRDSETATATVSAGMTTAAHVRSRSPNRTRARATPITSISTPE